MENVAIAVVGMLVWPAIALIVVIGFSFALYGLTWALLHWVDKNEVPNDRDITRRDRDARVAIPGSYPSVRITTDGIPEDFSRRLKDDIRLSRSLPPRTINRKINPEPGRKL